MCIMTRSKLGGYGQPGYNNDKSSLVTVKYLECLINQIVDTIEILWFLSSNGELNSKKLHRATTNGGFSHCQHNPMQQPNTY